MKHKVKIKTKPSEKQLDMINSIVVDISYKLLSFKPNCLRALDLIANGNALDYIDSDRDVAETMFCLAYVINPESWFGMGYNSRRWLPGECRDLMVRRYREMKGRQAPLWRMIWRYVKDVNEGREVLPQLAEAKDNSQTPQGNGEVTRAAEDTRQQVASEVQRLMPVF